MSSVSTLWLFKVKGLHSVAVCQICIPCSFVCLFVSGVTVSKWVMASTSTRFLDHTQRRTTVCRTSLDEWSARHRDLYLTIHTTLTTPGGIRTHNLSRRVPADLRFRPRGHWHQLYCVYLSGFQGKNPNCSNNPKPSLPTLFLGLFWRTRRD